MDLKKIIAESQNGFNSITDHTFLFSLSKFEQYVNESYEGRLFFELIQNARDAAFSGKINSDITIIVTAEKVLFANTGTPFDEKGVLAMTRLGLSPKDDNELIGSKGIGFKAIQEYSKTPKIITEFGTLYFDKELVKKILDLRFPSMFKDSSVPLFYYPHYEDRTCREVVEIQDRNYDTIIEFALNKGKPWNLIVSLFNKISDEELILLGSINSISFKSPYVTKNRLFKNLRDGYIAVESGASVKRFKVFEPETAVMIPDTVYDQLDDGEKKTYETDRRVEIKLVFECREDKTIIPKLNSKLFLYYPLEITSGFTYIIHSNFSCNPERISIRNTRLNNFLFDEISTMQTGQILDHLLHQDYKTKLIDYIYFDKKNEKLNILYKLYASKLRNKKFIWIENIYDYVSPDEIIYCSKEIYRILKTHTIEGKHLFTCDEKIKSFLTDNFKIKILFSADVIKYIEPIAEKEVQNPAFFEKLYSFFIFNNQSTYERRILLGSNNELYSKKDDVFYASSRVQIRIPQDISNQLILLHPEIKIKIEDVVKSTKLMGVKEYRTADLVDKALTLFSHENVNNYSILEFLLGMELSGQNIKDTIYRKLRVPIKLKKEWLMPVHNPVYFEINDLKRLYPSGNFIDMESCIDNISGFDYETIASFFGEFGVWNIPAMFFSDVVVKTLGDGRRTSKINQRTSKSAPAFDIKYDRMLDFPDSADYFFYISIYTNWKLYEEKIYGKNVFEFSAKSTLAYYADSIENCMRFTSFIKTVQERSWIFLNQEQSSPFKVDDILGLNKMDALTEKILLDRLNILVIDYDKNRSFIDLLGIDHYNAFSVSMIVSILSKTADQYAVKEGEVLESDFKKFYHVILKYLFNTFLQADQNKRESLFNLLRNTKFLCKKLDGSSELISWKPAKQIFHVDDRIPFESLPNEAKELMEYYFTKTDRNEIGRIFSRIGIKTSDEINEKLYLPDFSDELFLLESVKNMAYIIKTTEDSIGNHLPEKVFSKIRELRLRVCDEDLLKEVTLNSIPDFSTTFELKYFFDKVENAVYVSRKYLPIIEFKNLLSEIINSVFSNYLDKELSMGRTIKDLLFQKGSKTFIEALEYMDNDKERIIELEAILNENAKTPVQEFWSAVLSAKNIENIENQILQISGENFDILIDNLFADRVVIKKWFEEINYLNLNASSNLELFREISRIEAVSFDEVNQRLSKAINFEYLWVREFTVFKNKNLSTAKWQLFKYFEKKDIEMKMKFHNAHTEIEKLEMESVSDIQWEFDAGAYLTDLLNRRYDNFDISASDLENQDNDKLWKTLSDSLSGRKKHLYSILKSDEYHVADFDIFISREDNYSLLYFEEFEMLKRKYGSIYEKLTTDVFSVPQVKMPEFPSAEEDDFDIIECAIEEKQQNGTDVLDQVIGKINSTNGYTGGGGGGRIGLPNQKLLNHIGQQGEKLLFEKLSAIFGDRVTWVSENAVYSGFVPDKQALGYDMRYIDENNQTHYVEVKTSTGEEPEFHISINEIRSAKRYGSFYHVIWITNLFQTQKRQYMDLKNMFIDFKSGEDFFHNSKFYPELTAFKIVFKPHPVAVASANL